MWWHRKPRLDRREITAILSAVVALVEDCKRNPGDSEERQALAVVTLVSWVEDRINRKEI